MNSWSKTKGAYVYSGGGKIHQVFALFLFVYFLYFGHIPLICRKHTDHQTADEHVEEDEPSLDILGEIYQILGFLCLSTILVFHQYH